MEWTHLGIGASLRSYQGGAVRALVALDEARQLCGPWGQVVEERVDGTLGLDATGRMVGRVRDPSRIAELWSVGHGYEDRRRWLVACWRAGGGDEVEVVEAWV